MRFPETETQLSLMEGLYKRDKNEERLTDDLLNNLSNLKYAYSQIDLSLIPDEIRKKTTELFKSVLLDVANFAFESSRFDPRYKHWTRNEFKSQTVIRRDLNLSETRTLDELYDLTIRVRSRLKTALNRFEDICGEPDGCDIDETLKKLLNVANILDA